MSPAARRRLAWGAFVVLFLLHKDFWLWDDPSLLLGLPIGMTYHALVCLAAAGVMALLVRWAWPEGLDR